MARARVSVDQKVDRLCENVRASHDEFDLVVRLYETWRPAAHDEALFGRLGHSYAGQAFHVIREALQREVVIGLTKLWDNGEKSIGMDKVAGLIRDPSVIRALAVDRAGRIGFLDVEDEMERTLAEKAATALTIIETYSNRGMRRSVHDGLHRLRNTRFAHRQIIADAFSSVILTGLEVDTFYQDTRTLLHALQSLALGLAHNHEESAAVYRRYAEEFWAGVRSEKMEGHPNYRPLLQRLEPPEPNVLRGNP